MKVIRSILLVVLFSLCSSARAESEISVHSSKGEFSDVKERVVFSIESQGLVVNSISKLGEMLQRTGKSIGATRELYRDAELIEFCSASVSRQMMEADVHNIALCPYVIAVYTLSTEPNKVYISYRKPVAINAKSAKSAQAVEKLLREIVNGALH